MPIVRINAQPTGPVLHGTSAAMAPVLGTAARGTGPVIIMIHGYKYDPLQTRYCPHRRIFATRHNAAPGTAPGWPCQLGFGQGDPDEGLAVSFGWQARGPLARARVAAHTAGRQLADVITLLKSTAPGRPVCVMTHSMGSEVLFEALHHLPPDSISRALTLTAASYRSRAEAALDTPAGRTTELLNVTSRENDLFDCIFETLIAAPLPGDLAAGSGVRRLNAVNIEIDCPDTLRHLRAFGADIAAPRARICHWSAYTRPGVMQFYARALRAPDSVPLAGLQNVLPSEGAKRWSRLLKVSLPPATVPANNAGFKRAYALSSVSVP